MLVPSGTSQGSDSSFITTDAIVPNLTLIPIAPPRYAHPHTALPPLSSEDTEMNTEIPERPVVNMSIWYGSSGPLPNRAQFVCAYEMGFGVDDLPEAVFLVQSETDELWIIRDPPDGLLEMLAAGGELSPLTAMNTVTARLRYCSMRYSRLAWASAGRQGI
jgi:hypothetical protein